MGVKIRIVEVPVFYSPDQEQEWGQPDPKKRFFTQYPDQISRDARTTLRGLEVCAIVLPQGKLLIENKKDGKRRRKTRFVDGQPGYLVTKNEVIESLRKKSAEVADWWQNNWLSDWFSFGADEAVITRNLL